MNISKLMVLLFVFLTFFVGSISAQNDTDFDDNSTTTSYEEYADQLDTLIGKDQTKVNKKEERRLAKAARKRAKEEAKAAKRLAKNKKDDAENRTATTIEDEASNREVDYTSPDVNTEVDTPDMNTSDATAAVNSNEGNSNVRRFADRNKRGGKDGKKYTGSNEKKEGDKLYDILGYKASINRYQNLDAEEEKDREIMARIANSYRLNHDTENAEFWYSRFIDKTLKPEHLLHYAQALQSNGKCDKASKWYEKYKDVAPEDEQDKRDFIEDCSEQEAIVEHTNVKVYNVEELNTGHLDFTTIPFQDGVMITSTRGNNQLIQGEDIWTDDHFSDLFYAEQKADGTFEEPVLIFGDINDKYHDGVPTFAQGENVMYFTRNNYGRKSKDDLIDLKVFQATRTTDGYWSDAEELPFNSDEFTTCHPTLSDDGKKLYFASSRPGGYGGLDIWMSEFTGSWGEPVNLGPIVNGSGLSPWPGAFGSP